MSEDYPGQAYVHKYNANIKRAEEKAMSEQRAARGEGLSEAIERVKLMATGDPQWDLSENDRKALTLLLAALATPFPQAPPQCTCYMEANEATNGPCPIHNAPAATQEQPAGSEAKLLTAEDVESSILFSTGTFIDYAIAAASLNRKVRERLAGSPRKVGEDGQPDKLEWALMLLEQGTYALRGFREKDYPGTCKWRNDAKQFLATLARSSSVPVGEQKQEEGV